MSRRLVVSVLALVLVWSGASEALTFHVPGQHTRIQAAIDLASSSQIDTVRIAPGVYRERLRIIGKAVVVSGSGSDATTIDGQFSGNVFTIVGVGRNCVIEDMTVTGGDSNHPDSLGTAFYLNNYASPTIQRCYIYGNRARGGGGIAGYVNCEPLVRHCFITGNTGGGIAIELGAGDRGHTYADIENTVIVDNFGIGVLALKGARVTLRNCTIARNASDGLRSQEGARVRVFNTIIAGNSGAGIYRLENTVCFTLACNDVVDNTAGNYLGSNPGDACFPGRGNGDVSVDPCFQNAAAGNYHLQRHSPLCTLREPDSCGVLGAYEDLCVTGGDPCVVTIEQSTWSVVKTLFR